MYEISDQVCMLHTCYKLTMSTCGSTFCSVFFYDSLRVLISLHFHCCRDVIGLLGRDAGQNVHEIDFSLLAWVGGVAAHAPRITCR